MLPPEVNRYEDESVGNQTLMKCLVVISHPMKDNLCHHLRSRVVERLLTDGHDIFVEDLYADGFDPLLLRAERASYYSGRYDASAAIGQVKRLKEADSLILLFPTWWFGVPAMLKGWFDRVWGPGIAYDHADDLGPIRPRPDNLNKVLVITTLGAPWWADWLVMWRPVKRTLKIALLGACAKKSRLTFLSLYKSEKADVNDVNQFIRRIEKALENWRWQPIVMPTYQTVEFQRVCES
jgi:putative NADPH-quinone reductase